MSIPSALHLPSSAQANTCASSATSAETGEPTVQSEVKRLVEKRKGVEEQLEAYFDVLKSNNCTMDTPLVDREGFPRSDIDVAGVRTARVHIIGLRNDLKDVFSEMEGLVHRGLPRGEEATNGVGEEDQSIMEAEVVDGIKPFAKVDAVAPGSPANAAGLKRNDLLLALEAVVASNHDNLRAVAALVGRSEGVALSVKVCREGETLTLSLTPRGGWGGRGLLGCHIVPYIA
ncbi:26S proteasome non-atpase regulatory subunit 9 [Rhodotorula toruloides]|uniref:Probable 26S proteasome regulatory subunit p27 n=1 Tax=Rhodotorula toruloides TaxID=5286 RepID=A0A511KBY4_RHOTO|nr:26S proteasome non-atpase regulatory subunit 9 [Rhodotorula toruloides]